MEDSDARRRRLGLAAILLLALGAATIVPTLGWNQTSHYAQLRALAGGHTTIDGWQWQTGDKGFRQGHWYSDKAPGLAFASLPAYELLRAVGAPSAARHMQLTLQQTRLPGNLRSVALFGPGGAVGRPPGEPRLATGRELTGMIWALGLVTSVLPLIVLLLLVRRVAETLERGLGLAAAVTVGIGTLLLPFSTVYFSHMLAATLTFAAFALLWGGREGAALVVCAGLLCGLAVTCEYPVALMGAAVGLYALARGPRLPRAAAFGGGVLLGLLPLFAYNWWAFGSPFHVSYGFVEANRHGLFGTSAPSFREAVALLFSTRGLLRLSPVIALAIAGTAMLYRRGRRAEALTIGGGSLALLAYDCAYWQPLGGGTPGPRFLIAALPFLAVPLALVWRRLPVTTIVLAGLSATWMLAATLTRPLIVLDSDIGSWWHGIKSGDFTPTVVTALGGGNGWLAVMPFLFALAGALVCAALATRSLAVSARDVTTAAAAAVLWALIAYAAPHLLAVDRVAGEQFGAAAIVAFAAAATLALMREFRDGPVALVAALPLVGFALPGVRDHTKVALLLALAALGCALALGALDRHRAGARGGELSDQLGSRAA